MIVSREELKKYTNADFYDGSALHSRFAYKFFRDKTMAIGNIIAFRSPMDVTTEMVDTEDVLAGDTIHSDDAINLLIEIPNIDLFAGVCFQRLYISYIANILASQYLKCDIEVDGDDIMVHKEFTQGGIIQQKGKASVSIARQDNGAVLIHIGINVKAGKKAPAFAFSTNLTDEQVHNFMNECVAAYYAMAHDIFIATAKVV